MRVHISQVFNHLTVFIFPGDPADHVLVVDEGFIFLEFFNDLTILMIFFQVTPPTIHSGLMSLSPSYFILATNLSVIHLQP